MSDNEYARLRKDEVLKNSKCFRLQTIIWSNEKVFDYEEVCPLLSFRKTSIFHFSKSLSAVSLRDWTSMSIILWRDWVWADRNLFCLIMTAVKMINKRFKIISVFKLQTRDQLDWFALQFEKMLTYYRLSCFSQMGLNRSICCLLRDWYQKYSELTLTVIKNEKIGKWHDIQFS